jgi:hypothetical protein
MRLGFCRALRFGGRGPGTTRAVAGLRVFLGVLPGALSFSFLELLLPCTRLLERACCGGSGLLHSAACCGFCVTKTLTSRPFVGLLISCGTMAAGSGGKLPAYEGRRRPHLLRRRRAPQKARCPGHASLRGIAVIERSMALAALSSNTQHNTQQCLWASNGAHVGQATRTPRSPTRRLAHPHIE